MAAPGEDTAAPQLRGTTGLVDPCDTGWSRRCGIGGPGGTS
ncbi:hypothetical protein [Streptomyces coffeae]|nr:hypothetical protein [Streptomyces coffeae]